jgi:hypothetical protein
MQSLLLQPLGVDEMTIRILDQMEVDGTHIWVKTLERRLCWGKAHLTEPTFDI